MKSRKLVTWMLIVSVALVGAMLVIVNLNVPIRYALYAAGIAFGLDVLGLLAAAIAHMRHIDKLQERLEDMDLEHPEDALWDAADQTEEAYYQALKHLGLERRRLLSEQSKQRHSERKFLSQWARRIRTSISAIRLTLKDAGTPVNKALMEDLQSLEHYVDMASYYSRMNARDGDFYIKECDMGPVLRRVAEKFAAQTARRKLKLRYSGASRRVMTDEKCIQFILEQILSNALKFTNIGEITMYFEEPGVLCVRDTGVGMQPEEIEEILSDEAAAKPRKNVGKRMSGIGLVTCRRLAEQLGHEMDILSTPGSGTVVKITMEPAPEKEILPEPEAAEEPAVAPIWEEDVRVDRPGSEPASEEPEATEDEMTRSTLEVPRITPVMERAAEAEEPSESPEEPETPEETREPSEEAEAAPEPSEESLFIEPDHAEDLEAAEERDAALRDLQSEIIKALGLEYEEAEDDLAGPSLARATKKE